MRCFLFVLISFAICIQISAAIARTDFPPWEYSGLHNMTIECLVASEQIGASGGWVFAISSEGFHYHHRLHDKWFSRIEPGVPGRAVTSIYAHTWNPGWLVIGRVDADGHGYIEHTTDMGENLTVVHSSPAGVVTAIHGGSYYDYRIWACTAAAAGPGELLYSDDDGLTWTPVTGHGHGSLNDLFCWSRDVVFVAGDKGLAVTSDGGATWQPLTAGLPAGPVHHLNHLGPAVAVPAAADVLPDIQLFAATDAGLYFTTDSGYSWTQALAEPCISVSLQYWPYGGEHVLVVTADNRILWDENFTWQWEDMTNELSEATLRGGIILVEEHWVATDQEGVYLSAIPFGSDVPDTPSSFRLTAAPNPFNPITVLHFVAPADGHARLVIYDLAGRLVDTLLDRVIVAGKHEVPWQPRELASGAYLARLSLNGREQSLSLLLTK
jgi:photosystem II stability/assembly factor-like uncharacterized protein